LSDTFEENTLIVDPFHEFVGYNWWILFHKALFGEHVKRFGVGFEVVYGENCFRLREVIFLKLTV
jgi:hypothetical protein